MFRQKIVWSPVEVEFLRNNRALPVEQLTIALAKSVNAIKTQLRVIDGKQPPPSKANSRRSRIGKREDLGMFFRSSYEANLARILNHKKISWSYEPQVFFFEGVKKGTISYLPDFRIEKPDGSHSWIETKGYLDKKGKTALTRFKKFYPQEFACLEAICDRPNSKTDVFLKKLGIRQISYMKELEKLWKGVIPNWE